jgi:hypothetical protein
MLLPRCQVLRSEGGGFAPRISVCDGIRGLLVRSGFINIYLERDVFSAPVLVINKDTPDVMLIFASVCQILPTLPGGSRPICHRKP